MNYTVIERFFDLLDNGFLYEVGDTFPRTGYEPSKERLDSLLSSNNPQLRPFIEKVDKKELSDFTIEELKHKAKELDMQLPPKIKKSEIIELLQNN